jgi:hypothetical protein
VLLALALSLASPQPPTLPWGLVGRVYTSASLHVGIRPAIYLDSYEAALGVTVQVTALVL